jgi:hypothetical protein
MTNRAHTTDAISVPIESSKTRPIPILMIAAFKEF